MEALINDSFSSRDFPEIEALSNDSFSSTLITETVLGLPFNILPELTMADDKVDNQASKEFSDLDLHRSVSHVEELMKKIDELERERDGLGNEIARRKTEIDNLTQEIDSLRGDELQKREKIEGLGSEFERPQVAMKGAKAVAARKANLEAEASRRHCDSVSAKMIAVDALDTMP